MTAFCPILVFDSHTFADFMLVVESICFVRNILSHLCTFIKMNKYFYI